MRSTLAVANHLIRQAHAARVEITGGQLQSLIYLAHGLRMGLISEPLLDDAVFAEASGVTIPALNRAGARGDHAMRQLLTEIKTTPQGLLDEVAPALDANDPVLDTLKMVWTRFSAFRPLDLSTFITSAGSPWEQTWTNRAERGGEVGRTLSEVWQPDHTVDQPVVIPNSLIRNWFRSLVIQEMKQRAGSDGLEETVRLSGREIERSMRLDRP